jgi:glycine/D-amino acid oxidase-like deaminating enzyme
MTVAGRSTRRVAVLGGGIMGVSTSLFLARQGVEVVLYDAMPSVLAGASRWNEGKIHLGYLYAGDPTLATAKKLLTAGLMFPELVEQLTGEPARYVTGGQDCYLVHRDSVVGPDAVAAYFRSLADLIDAHPLAGRYWGGVARHMTAPLARNTLESMVDTRTVVAGFTAPEKSVCTQSLADSLCRALEAERNITLRTGCKVLSGQRMAGSQERYSLATTEGQDAGFTHVVNALWEGRPAVDQTLGIDTVFDPTARYRVSLFVRTDKHVSAPSAVICTGPFGDIKNYDGRRFYLSWYDTGLRVSSNDMNHLETPFLSPGDKEGIAADTAGHLGRLLPCVGGILAAAEEVRVEGGWVFANGSGALSDPGSTLHRRERVGIHQSDNWFSVDTGKYSLAPWLARELTAQIMTT